MGAEIESRSPVPADAPLRLSLYGAVQSNPDQEAALRRLAGQIGAPVESVRAFPDEAKRQAFMQQDFERLQREFPKTMSFLTDPDKAAVTHDDIDTFKSIEKTIGGIASWVMGARPDRGLPGAADRLIVAPVVSGIGPRAAAGMLGAITYPVEAVGADNVAATLRGMAAEQKAKADRWKSEGLTGAATGDLNLLERGIQSGMESAGQNLLTLPLGLARTTLVTGEQLMLGAMGLFTFGQEYLKARDKGMTIGGAGFHGMEQATAEVVTEKFAGAVGLLRDLKAGMGVAKTIFRDIAREIPGEMGATLWQNFNDWANLNPEKPVADFLKEQPEALAETVIATIVGAGAQTGAVRGIQKALDGAALREAQAARTEALGRHLETLQKAGSASKVLARDATTAKEFIDQVAAQEGADPVELFVDGKQLMATLNQSAMTVEELAAVAPVVAGQLEQVESGVDVRMPVSEFLAIGDKVTTPLIDHIRVDPERDATRAEAAKFMEERGAEIEAVVQRELERRQIVSEHRDQIATIAKTIESQLVASGRYPASVSKVQAEWFAGTLGVLAQRANTTPQELAKRYQLGVAPMAVAGEAMAQQGGTVWDDMFPGEFATKETTVETDVVISSNGERAEGGNVNSRGQQITATKQGLQRFWNWFADSQATDDAGLPLVLYHSTNSDITQFETNRETTNNYGLLGDVTTRRAGIFLTPDPKFSQEYLRSGAGQNVMQVYAALKNPLDLRRGISERVEAELEAAGVNVRYVNNVQNVWELFDSADDGTNDFVDALKAAGYDGAIFREDSPGGESEGGTTYVAFRPEQIKSATGNRGTFDESGNILHQSMSTRLPSAVGATEDPLASVLSIDFNTVLADQRTLEKNARTMSQHVNHRPLRGPGARDPANIVESLIQHMSSNLLWLHDQMTPEWRARAKLWYDGGRKTVEAWAERYGISEMQAAAVIAVLSPQNGWFENVSQAERILDMLFGLRDFRWDDAMTAEANAIVAVAEKTKAQNAAKAAERAAAAQAKAARDARRAARVAGAEGQPEAPEATPAQDDVETAAESVETEEDIDAEESADLMDLARGKTLGEVLSNPSVAARWIRVYDQSHNNRTYAVLTPEGGVGGVSKTPKGKDATLRWKSYNTIAKAVSVSMDGRAENVHYQIGREHKVRNFYNNLFAPNSPLGFTTIDTHAVAAAYLRALSSASPEVNQAFGSKGASSSAQTGLNGTYPIFLEAYRRAAEARGLLPREMQSITWEAIRGLFEAHLKKGLKDDANWIWQTYKDGDIEQADAQEQILGLAGGITAPAWVSLPYNDVPARTYSGAAQAAIDARQQPGAARANPPAVMLEVAPDPNDAALTQQWNALPADDKLRISIDVANTMTAEVLREFGVGGSFSVQVGGYLGATNPSLALQVERAELALPVAKLLGHVLSQDAMMIVSEEPALGLEKTGAVTIQLPAGWGDKEITALYDRLWTLERDGKKLVGGHSTANGQMSILNYSGLSDQEFSKAIFDHLGGNFNVTEDVVYAAFPGKAEYGYGQVDATGGAAARGAPVQRRPDRLRRQATELVREALARAAAGPAGTADAAAGQVAAPAAPSPAPTLSAEQQAELVELRKRESVLKSLQECMA